MHILKFEEKRNAKGQITHYIEYAANPMEAQLTATSAPVKWFIPTEQDWDAPESNEHAAVKKLRWEKFVKPAYENWKNGHEIPVNGTPLSAWYELSKPQIEALRTAGLSSIEQVAEMNDTVMGMVALPNKHGLKMAAQAFLKAADGNAAANEIATLKAKIEALEDAAKPKRGRPKKEPTDGDSHADP